MNKRCWMIFGLVFLLILPTSMPAFGWDTIISFGDSLSDDGNGLPNNGVPIDPYLTASDGPVWLNYLAGSMTEVELEGRAIVGAQTSGPTSFGIDIGMTEQINRYVSALPTDADLSGILFTVWIGGNDFLNMGPQDPQVVIGTAIYRIDVSIQELVVAGAEDILIMNLPDLGLAPIYNNDPYASAMATMLSATFNAALTQLVCDLKGAYPDVKFYMADTFKLLQFAVENGEDLGFTNVSEPCDPYHVGLVCEGYIFWDGIHPTTATHKYLAALALGQVKHGRIIKEMKDMLKELNPIHPRKPFVVNCFE